MHISAGVLAELLEQDLIRNGWDGSLELYPGIPERQVAFQKLKLAYVKKYLPGTSGGTSLESDKAALELFLRTNEACRVWEPDLSLFDSVDEIALGEAKAFIQDFFFTSDGEFVLSRSNIYSWFGLGNGKNIGSGSTDLYSKLSTSRLSSTSLTLLDYYREGIEHHPTWTGLEACRYSRRGVDLVSSSRLSFVPKTTEISRTICTEPILNMLFQKGIGRSIEARLRQVLGIDLSRQPEKNALLARFGSIDGRFGTIDLSSASDSVSLPLCEYLLPRQVLYWLKLTRCEQTTLPGGKKIDLHMVSSMGNAFTFPLQTLLFSAVVYGVYRSLGIKLRKPFGRHVGNFGVFGDDIIVETRSYDRVIKMLKFLGFTVNVDKSFNTGLFRESCGSDFYSGYNVRGVYLKRLADVSDVYSAINRLVRWCARHSASLTLTIDFLISKLPRKYCEVPYDESDDAGVKVHSDLISDRFARDRNGAIRYVFRKLVPNQIRIPKDESTPTRLPDWFYNQDGLLFSVVAGSIRNGFVVVRSNRRKAIHRRNITPCWDYIPFAHRESGEYGDRWKAATLRLLGRESQTQLKEG